jgi:hypothetical protein
MARIGEWELTRPFALGNFYNEFIEAVKFSTEFVNVTPVLSEFAVSGIDPSGSRHLTNHASFSETLASGRGQASFNYGNIDMSVTDISTGSGVSRTRVFIFRVNQFDCSTSKVHGMRIWASDTSDFLTDNTHKIIYETSRTWKQDNILPVSWIARASGSRHLSTSLPDKQNLFRQDGGYSIHGSGDADVSEYVYMAVTASGTLPLGQYGSTATSGFLVRISYNLDNIFPLKD